MVTQLISPTEKLRDYEAILVYSRSFKALLTIHCTSCFELNFEAKTTQTEQTQEINSFLKRIIILWAVGSDVEEKEVASRVDMKTIADMKMAFSFSLFFFTEIFGRNWGAEKISKTHPTKDI